jgi:WD40 repeat protein
MTPGGQPLEQLAVAIERLTGVMKSGDFIRGEGLENPAALHQQAEILLTDDANQRLVLLVDQFEESFTQTKDEAVRAAFIALLTTASQTPNGRAIIILSLRSDFISHCARYPNLRELMNKQFLLVGAMEAHDLAKAITLPALEVGAEIDPALVSRILADMKGEPGALPLMSFALRDLFEAEKTAKGQPMDLTLPEYLRRGGIEQALERHANGVFAGFTEEQKGVAKAVFSRLIEIGQGRQDTRRTAVFSELVPAGRSVEEVTAVVETLAREGARLLTTSGTSEAESATATNVTIAHERLIDAWPWLRQLVDENREAIALQNQIAHEAKAWAENHDASYLFRGGRLVQVQDKLQDLEANLDEVSHQFIVASIEAAEAAKQAEAERIKEQESLRQEQANASRFRRLTRWLSVAAGVAVVATFIALFFLNQARAAEAQLQQLKNAIQASRLAALTEAVSMNNNNEQSLLLAVAGLATKIQANTRFQLHEQLKSWYRASLHGHEGGVYSAVFSPDGQTVLTAGCDALDLELFCIVSTVRLWNLEREEPFILYEAEHQTLTSAAFSPDGQTILITSTDGTVRLLNKQGEQIIILGLEVENRDYGGMFSHDGQMILTNFSGTVKLWNREGELLDVFSVFDWNTDVSSAVLNPDGQIIVTADCENSQYDCTNGMAHLWDLAGNELAALRGHGGWVYSAIFSPDGQTILTASEDGTARIWDLAGNELVVLHGHVAGVNSAVFSPDGQTILTASWDSTARLWDLAGNELVVLHGHVGGVNSAAFSPDGQRIVTAGSDGTVQLWSWQVSELAILRGHVGGVNSAVFSPDGQRIVTAGCDETDSSGYCINTNGTVRLWDGAGNELALLRGHEGSVNSAVFSPYGQTIVTAGCDEYESFTCTKGTAWLWDGAGNELAVLRGHEGGVRSAVFSPDGQMIVTASEDGTARLWDGAGKELAVLRGHEGWVNSALFSPDGQRIVTASNDGTARLWDGAGNELAVLNGHEGLVDSAIFSPDGQRIVTASLDGTARLWNLQGEELMILHGHESGIRSVVFSSDGQTILTAGCDSHNIAQCNNGTIRLWNLQGEVLTVLHGHDDWVQSAVFSLDGQTILSSSLDGTARLWNLQGEQLAVLNGHKDSIWSAIFSPDGQTILTFSIDGTVRLWPNITIEYMVKEAFGRIKRGFTEAECQQFFRDDVSACPDTKKQLFEPLKQYLSPEQQEEWASLP